MTWTSRSGHLAILGLVGLASLGPMRAYAQEHSADHHDPSQPPPLLVDGRTDPSLIPDVVAYRHFVMAVSLQAEASEEDVRRRDAFLAMAALPPADRIAVILATAGVADELAIGRQLKQSQIADVGALAAHHQRRDLLLRNAQERIQTALTPEGNERLARFIQRHMKTKIRIYGTMPIQH